MPDHEKIDYVEYAANDLTKTKAFFNAVFGWEFQDYGDTYTAFANEGLDGGFYHGEKNSDSEQGGALIVFFSRDLENTQEKILRHGGIINKEIFSFPGGRRFHFKEPSGNEFAVWAET